MLSYTKIAILSYNANLTGSRQRNVSLIKFTAVLIKETET